MEKIYIISDIEIGRRDQMDDSDSDEIFAEFIEFISKRGHNSNTLPNNQQIFPSQKTGKDFEKTTLILNGDTFDFLKMAYKGDYPRLITEEISLWKINEIINSHKLFFQSLKKFLTDPKHHLKFTIGNHDADLAWPEVQKRINDELESNNIAYAHEYNLDKIHIEHGNLIDPFYTMNPQDQIIKYKGEDVLNLPWGSRIIFSDLIKIKQNFPEEEKIQPVTEACKRNPAFKRYLEKTIANVLFKNIIWHTLTKFYDSTYHVPIIRIIKKVFETGRNIKSHDQYSGFDFDYQIKIHPTFETFVLGHCHNKSLITHKQVTFITTDTWRKEYKNNKKKNKTYAEIIIEDNSITHSELKDFTPAK